MPKYNLLFHYQTLDIMILDEESFVKGLLDLVIFLSFSLDKYLDGSLLGVLAALRDIPVINDFLSLRTFLRDRRCLLK